MNETPTVEELQAYVANVKQGAAIIYSVMNKVYALHDVTEAEQCSHCKVAYPCDTVKILLEEMIPAEETPAE